MAARLSDPTIKELTLVFAHKDGADWAPRNEEARVLAVKGEKTDEKPAKNAVARAIDTLKAYFASNDDLAGFQFPVTVAADNIDGDGDGPEDYNQICSALCAVFCDIQAASGISDDEARSSAIVGCVDAFLKGLDGMRSGKDDDGSEKSGARHSAADTETLGKIAAAHQSMLNQMEAIGGALTELGVTGAKGPVEGQTGPTQDDGPDTENGAAAKAKEKPEGDYGSHEEAGYADPGYQEDKKPRYPLKEDGKISAARVRAAWGFINHEDNAKLYSAEDLAKIKDAIRAAAKEVGVEIADDSKKSGELEMTEDAIKALIAESVAQTANAVKAELQPQIDAAKAEVDAAKALAEQNAKLAEAYKEQAEQNAAVIAAVGGSVTTKSALSSAVEVQKSRLNRVMIETMRENPEPTRF